MYPNAQNNSINVPAKLVKRADNDNMVTEQESINLKAWKLPAEMYFIRPSIIL